MKFGVAILVIVVILVGCSKESDKRFPRIPTAPTSPVAPVPPAPPTPTTGPALLWVMVLNESAVCIDGATIQIVGAHGAGEAIPQETPCAASEDYSGGLILKDLTPGVQVTVRAAASGYTPREMSFFPYSPDHYKAVFIELSKAQ